MFSAKLVQLVEDHWEKIADRVQRKIAGDPRLDHIKTIPASELRELARDIVKNLDHWLLAPDEQEMARRHEAVGRRRFEETIPLHETVRAYLLIKNEILQFVREQGIAETPVTLYAEEELELCIGRFFDHVIYHLVHGYEEAIWRSVKGVVANTARF